MSMTKEKVLNVISALLRHTETDCDYAYDNADGSVDLLPGQDIADALQLALAALREQAERRWIPVTERMPDEDVRVIVRIDRTVWNTAFELDADRRHNGEWVRWGRAVTNWMPMPEAAKEG